MATIGFAMWLQDQSGLAHDHHLIMIFIGLIALAIAIVAIAMLAISVKVLGTVKEIGIAAGDFKVKALPLLDELMEVTKVSRVLLQDAAPKVKTITDNLVKTTDTLVETSKIAKAAVQQIDTTVADVNQRAQKQVARVDGMVTVALTTTFELVETIGNGIRVPVQKIALMANQGRALAEGLFAKVKSMAGASPFGGRRDS
jgi:methyl-accepting chemotaxis protein